MSKAILVMDMPSSCEKCRLHSFVGKDCDVICKVQGQAQSYEEAYKGKPKWCPLREVPQKQEDLPTNIYRDGWNACIDKILKGSE